MSGQGSQALSGAAWPAGAGVSYPRANPADVDERLRWPAYQEAYQVLLERTSTDYAPWHVVPCDRKWYSRLAILELLIEALEGLNLSWPPADFDVKAEKKRLAAS